MAHERILNICLLKHDWRKLRMQFRDSCTLNTSLLLLQMREGAQHSSPKVLPSWRDANGVDFALEGVMAGPTQPMADRSLSLHLCELHRNPLPSENVEDAEQPGMHAAREMDAAVFNEKWEGRGENNAPPGRPGHRRAAIQSGGRGEASELRDLAQMSAPPPAALYQIESANSRPERGGVCVCVSFHLNCLSLRQTEIMSPFTFMIYMLLTLTVDFVPFFC